jgi:hypothetical protein
METAFPLPIPMALVLAIAAVGTGLAAILPTCLYLYVEPRGRRQWGAAGAVGSPRKAPFLVRATAWLSFALGQLALPWLIVPVACAGLVYLQAKLGVLRPVGLAVTVAAGAAAVAETLVAVRLLPLGVRLLARDAKLCAGVGREAGHSPILTRARWNAAVSAAVLAGCLGLSWAMSALPGLVHPWLRAALAWTALRPVMAYAAVCLLHALLLGRCARALAAEK